jgi:DNA-binding MurR/RpiR family transcriptional regulator
MYLQCQKTNIRLSDAQILRIGSLSKVQGLVRKRLQGCLEKATKAEKAVATYMLNGLTQLPFQSAAEIAEQVGVSELTVGRFCRSLGYDRYKDLIAELRDDIGSRPWLIGDRLLAFRKASLEQQDSLARSLELEIAALVKVYEIPSTGEWKTCIRRMARSKRVFIAGFQTERGLASYFGHQLQYVRDGVQILDLGSGNFAELLLGDTKHSALVIFEARRYSRLALNLARRASEIGIPVTLITDSFCDWGRDHASEVFAVQTEANLFFESTAPMASLVNLMINATFNEIGSAAEPRVEAVSKLYSEFTGHVGNAAGQNAASA